MMELRKERSKFTQNEDSKLKTLYYLYKGQWKKIALHFDGKTARQCRERWHYYLASGINKGSFSNEEIKQLRKLVIENGHNWRIISANMNRTEVQVKNEWKRLVSSSIRRY